MSDHFIPVVVGSFSDGLYIMGGKVSTYSEKYEAMDDASEKAARLCKKHNGVSFYPLALKCIDIEKADKDEKEQYGKPTPIMPRDINELDDFSITGATVVVL